MLPEGGGPIPQHIEAATRIDGALILFINPDILPSKATPTHA